MGGYPSDDDNQGVIIEEYDNEIKFSLNGVMYLRITRAGFFVFDQYVEDKHVICSALVDWFKACTQEIEGN